jgi:hypothetical protein
MANQLMFLKNRFFLFSIKRNSISNELFLKKNIIFLQYFIFFLYFVKNLKPKEYFNFYK